MSYQFQNDKTLFVESHGFYATVTQTQPSKINIYIFTHLNFRDLAHHI